MLGCRMRGRMGARRVEKRICKHTSYPRGSSSRVAVNPGTLILMRLRHVPGRSTLIPSPVLSCHSMSVLRAAESSGVWWSLQREVHAEPRALYNTQLPPTRSFSSACLALSPPLSLSFFLSGDAVPSLRTGIPWMAMCVSRNSRISGIPRGSLIAFRLRDA